MAQFQLIFFLAESHQDRVFFFIFSLQAAERHRQMMERLQRYRNLWRIHHGKLLGVGGVRFSRNSFGLAASVIFFHHCFLPIEETGQWQDLGTNTGWAKPVPNWAGECCAAEDFPWQRVLIPSPLETPPETVAIDC